MIVLGYMFLAFGAVRLCCKERPTDARAMPPVTLWSLAASIGGLTAAMLLLKPTLLAYVLLIFWLGTFNVPRHQRYRVAGSAVGIALVLIGLAWFVLQGSGLQGGVSAARALFSGLWHATSAEPFFHLLDLVTPGTIYFVPVLGCLFWLFIVVSTAASPRDRALRSFPLIVLAGGLLYGFAMIKRPGNATMFGALLYILLTGTLCLIVQSPKIQRITLLAWVTLLLLHTGAIARVTLLPFAWSGRHSAEIAAQIDEYARSFQLPILYLHPDPGPGPPFLFESAASAVFSGTLRCRFADATCSSAYQNRWLSGLKPYRLVRVSDGLPSERFVLLFADVPNAPSVAHVSSMARDALARAQVCRRWEQSNFTVHVCHIPPSPQVYDL